MKFDCKKKSAETSGIDVAGEIVKVQEGTETISERGVKTLSDASSNRKSGFSVGEISGKPRWFVSKQKKFHKELLSLFQEIKEHSSSYELLETYTNFNTVVDLCRRCWPVIEVEEQTDSEILSIRPHQGRAWNSSAGNKLFGGSFSAGNLFTGRNSSAGNLFPDRNSSVGNLLSDKISSSAICGMAWGVLGLGSVLRATKVVDETTNAVASRLC